MTHFKCITIIVSYRAEIIPPCTLQSQISCLSPNHSSTFCSFLHLKRHVYIGLIWPRFQASAEGRNRVCLSTFGRRKSANAALKFLEIFIEFARVNLVKNPFLIDNTSSQKWRLGRRIGRDPIFGAVKGFEKPIKMARKRPCQLLQRHKKMADSRFFSSLRPEKANRNSNFRKWLTLTVKDFFTKSIFSFPLKTSWICTSFAKWEQARKLRNTNNKSWQALLTIKRTLPNLPNFFRVSWHLPMLNTSGCPSSYAITCYFL